MKEPVYTESEVIDLLLQQQQISAERVATVTRLLQVARAVDYSPIPNLKSKYMNPSATVNLNDSLRVAMNEFSNKLNTPETRHSLQQRIQVILQTFAPVQGNSQLDVLIESTPQDIKDRVMRVTAKRRDVVEEYRPLSDVIKDMKVAN